MKDSFSTFHPFVNFLYFVVVLLFSMVFMHPIFQVIALISAVVYSFMLKGKKAIKFNLLYMVPFLLFMAMMTIAAPMLTIVIKTVMIIRTILSRESKRKIEKLVRPGNP